MRLPRVRYTVLTLMGVVAALAVGLGAIHEHARIEKGRPYQQMASFYAIREQKWREIAAMDRQRAVDAEERNERWQVRARYWRSQLGMVEEPSPAEYAARYHRSAATGLELAKYFSELKEKFEQQALYPWSDPPPYPARPGPIAWEKLPIDPLESTDH